MKRLYIEETFAAERLRQLYPESKVEERGKSNAFCEDILITHPDGRKEKVEVKQAVYGVTAVGY